MSLKLRQNQSSLFAFISEQQSDMIEIHGTSKNHKKKKIILFHRCNTSILKKVNKNQKSKKVQGQVENQDPVCCAFRKSRILTGLLC